MIYLDFETESIDKFPNYPPKPVGCAILADDEAKYYAWGHPSDNNCTLDEFKSVLRTLTFSYKQICMHNAMFDCMVLKKYFDFDVEHEHIKIHDTMVLGFLDNPHSNTLGLKELANHLLGIENTEQQELGSWIRANVKEAKNKATNWGGYISYAPGSIVAPYAIGDVVRTKKLFDVLYDRIVQNEMLGAYIVEMSLVPILIRNSLEGIAVDTKLLEQDITTYSKIKSLLDIELFTLLGEINFNSGAQVAKALLANGYATEEGWPKTKTGLLSTSKEVLLAQITDKSLLEKLVYRASLGTCLSTFMLPWHEMSSKSGVIQTHWNTTKGENVGARTGRLSSTPNFQNIPKEFNPSKFGNTWSGNSLPMMRKYIISDNEHQTICRRDFNSQELRVFAHFEDGLMMQEYQADPKVDIHQRVTEVMNKASGKDYPRSFGKTLNFCCLYGGGVTRLSEAMDVDKEVAREILNTYKMAVPGLANLNNKMRVRANHNMPIRTLGGRLYYVEPPKIINGVRRTFEYKLVNVLVQGSSADMTKRAIIKYDRTKVHGRMMLNVHDEILISVPEIHAKEEMQILKESMESALKLDVMVLSDGKIGKRWTEMKEYVD